MGMTYMCICTRTCIHVCFKKREQRPNRPRTCICIRTYLHVRGEILTCLNLFMKRMWVRTYTCTLEDDLASCRFRQFLLRFCGSAVLNEWNFKTPNWWLSSDIGKSSFRPLRDPKLRVFAPKWHILFFLKVCCASSFRF